MSWKCNKARLMSPPHPGGGATNPQGDPSENPAPEVEQPTRGQVGHVVSTMDPHNPEQQAQWIMFEFGGLFLGVGLPVVALAYDCPCQRRAC